MLKSLVLLLPILILMPDTTSAAAAAPKPIDDAHAQQIDRAVAGAIDLEMTPGAVVVAGRAGGNAFEKAYGHLTYDPNSPADTTGTVFDLASLSKSIGCATSIMILADRGKLSVSDPVSKYIPGMNTADKKDITIEQCLLHRAGFIPDNPIKDFSGSPESAYEKIYQAKLKYEPGKDYEYSDNSFLVLGEVVRAASGKPLDQFAQENIFKPLKMTHTTYNPPKDWDDNIAPTEKRDGKWITGVVHDPRSYALGGVAGHAGVFATGDDVARFCRMLLNKGELDGARILSQRQVEEMTKPRWLTTPKGEKIARGYGLDIDSPHSPAPRGKVFEKDESFGHTGYTGTSYWIDPKSDAFVVLLTNRVHPDDDADIKMLRKRIGTIAGEALAKKND